MYFTDTSYDAQTDGNISTWATNVDTLTLEMNIIALEICAAPGSFRLYLVINSPRPEPAFASFRASAESCEGFVHRNSSVYYSNVSISCQVNATTNIIGVQLSITFERPTPFLNNKNVRMQETETATYLTTSLRSKTIIFQSKL